MGFCGSTIKNSSKKGKAGSFVETDSTVGEKNYLIPCWFCMFAHWQRNDKSIILMVGLFEQWETE